MAELVGDPVLFDSGLDLVQRTRLAADESEGHVLLALLKADFHGVGTSPEKDGEGEGFVPPLMACVIAQSIRSFFIKCFIPTLQRYCIIRGVSS